MPLEAIISGEVFMVQRLLEWQDIGDILGVSPPVLNVMTDRRCHCKVNRGGRSVFSTLCNRKSLSRSVRSPGLFIMLGILR
jgi:hypothetical protein